MEHADTPQPLLSTATRAVAAVLVTIAVAAAWVGAGQASHRAVDATSAVLARPSAPAVLPAIEVVAHADGRIQACLQASAASNRPAAAL